MGYCLYSITYKVFIKKIPNGIFPYFCLISVFSFWIIYIICILFKWHSCTDFILAYKTPNRCNQKSTQYLFICLFCFCLEYYLAIA